MGLLETLLKKEESFDDLRDEDVLEQSITKPEAFRVLIRRHEAAFLRKARTILRDEKDAEDAVQETFIKIYKAASRFQEIPGARFTSWAYTILINTSITKYHSIKRHRVNTMLMSDELEAVIYDANDIRRHEEKLNRDYLLSLTKSLPELLKRTVTLCTVDGLSHKEIAEIEDVTEGVIRTRLHRARQLLKREHKNEHE